MTPIQEFLTRLHPEVLQGGKIFLQEGEIAFGTPDNALLRKLVLEHHAKGQEALKGFRKWLVRKEGYAQKEADAYAAQVWNVLCLTYNPDTGDADPLSLVALEDARYAYSTKQLFVVSLRLWAKYTNDSEMFGRLLRWGKRAEVVPNYVLEDIQRVVPYEDAEYRRMLEAVEKYAGSPRFPWGYACLRLAFALGTAPSEIVLITKKAIMDGVESGWLTLRHGRRGTFRLPCEAEADSLRGLLAMPCEWGILADLVDPLHHDRPNRNISVTGLRKLIVDVYRRAEVAYDQFQWVFRVRRTIAWQYYRASRNVVAAAQISRQKDIQRMQRYLDELAKLCGLPN